MLAQKTTGAGNSVRSGVTQTTKRLNGQRDERNANSLPG